MIILSTHKQYILCKDIFLRFAEQFSRGTMNDIEFFQYHKELMRREPEMTNFIYQFTLTSCYKRENYNAHELMRVFDNTFKIKDVYGLNGLDCDISTLNSAIVVDFMVRNTPFKSLPMTILNAPLEYGTPLYKRVQAEATVSKYIEKSKSQTGQTNNDVQIGESLYDIKHTAKTSTVYNHIYPWTAEQIEDRGQHYVNNLYTSLKNHNNLFARDMAEELFKLKNNLSITPLKKIQIINDYLNKEWISIEKQSILVPIVIPMTLKPFTPRMPKTCHEQLHIQANVTENHAAWASIDIRYKSNLKQVFHAANEMTNGLINSTLPEENLDLPD